MDIRIETAIFFFLLFQLSEIRSEVSTSENIPSSHANFTAFSGVVDQRASKDFLTIAATDRLRIIPSTSESVHDATTAVPLPYHSNCSAAGLRMETTNRRNTISPTPGSSTKQLVTNKYFQQDGFRGFCQQRLKCYSTKSTTIESDLYFTLAKNICNDFVSTEEEQEEKNCTSLVLNHCTNLECFPCTCDVCELGSCEDNVTGANSNWGRYTGCLSKDKVQAIVRCPDGWPMDSEVREACEFGQGKVTKDEPVSSMVNNITFRNEHCAMCHGVHNYQRWKLSVSCQHFQYVYMVESREELVEKVLEYTNTCSINHAQPDEVYTQECSSDLKWYNTPQMITSCNVTGQWERLDEALVQNCARYKAAVFRVSEKMSPVVYQNVYCAMCNGVRITFGQHFCSPPTSFQNELLHPPLTLLLGVHAEREDSPGPVIAPRGCPTGTWRNLEDICERARCTEGKVLSEGDNQCNTAMSTIHGLAYDLDITLLPNQQIVVSNCSQTWEQFTLNFKEVLKAKLSHQADFYDIQCFPTIMYEGDDTLYVEKMKVKGWVVSNTRTNRDVVEQTWVDSLLRDWKVNGMENKTVIFTVTHFPLSVNKCSTDDNTPKHLHFNLTSVSNFDPKNEFPFHLNIPLTPLLTCPFIQFEAHQFKIVRKFDTKADSPVETILKSGTYQIKLTVNTNVYILDQTLYVCIAELEKLHREMRYGLNIWDASYSLYVMSMVVIPLSIVSLLLILFVYAVLPALRTQPGLNMMGTCLSLMVAQLSLLLAAHRLLNGALCIALGVVVHMSWLSTFCWTFVSSLHMFQTFSPKCPSVDTGCSLTTTFRYVLLASLAVPGAVVSTVMAVSFFTTQGQSIGYSSVTCYLNSPLLVGLAVIMPLVLILLANMYFFLRAILHIYQVVKLQANVGNETRSRRHHLRVCLRLSLLTGAIWIFSLVAENLDIDWLRALSILTNGGQGILLLLSYVTTRRVVATLAVKFGCRPVKDPINSKLTFLSTQKLGTKTTEVKSSVKINPFKGRKNTG